LSNSKLVRTNTIQRGYEAPEYMVAAPVFMPFFDNPDILGPFYHAEHLLVPSRVTADGTGIRLGKTAALGTAADLVVEGPQFLRQLSRIAGIRIKNVIGEPAGGLFSDTRQLG
jgi:hypothetical protein